MQSFGALVRHATRSGSPAGSVNGAPPVDPSSGAIDELYRQLGVGPEGLSSAEADRRLARYGPNEPPSASRRGALASLLALFANPLVLILLAAAVVSGFLRDTVGALLIVTIVVSSTTLNFALGYRSQRAAERLRDAVAPMATVLRDARWLDLPRRALVPGDVIRLCAGDLVPADARLVSARDLHVQQAALTGESLPVEKEVTASTGPAKPDDLGAVFLGTSVVSGTAVAEVTATGRATAFGDIAARLRDKPPETEFERGTRRFGLFISQTVVVLAFAVLLICAVVGRPMLESLLFAISLAVGLTPEFLPMIVAVTLARGAVRMA